MQRQQGATVQDRHFRLLTLGIVALFSSIAWAAPPASCATKFIGTWTYPGGTTTVNADGTANPQCPACVRVQTWTCQGNTYLFSNSGPPGQFSATLINSNQMQGSGIIATRVGGPAPRKKENSGADCTTPAAGQVKRHSPSHVCIEAKNTNQDSRCVYSFTYRHSKAGVMQGGNVAAGASAERCALQEGVELSFVKWTKSAGSAR
jgi:hypothetical protein